MDVSTVSLMIALVGCFVGFAGFLMKRDDKKEIDSEFRGEVKARLDTLISSNASVVVEVRTMANRLAKSEQSLEHAHKRIDDTNKRVDEIAKKIDN